MIDKLVSYVIDQSCCFLIVEIDPYFILQRYTYMKGTLLIVIIWNYLLACFFIFIYSRIPLLRQPSGLKEMALTGGWSLQREGLIIVTLLRGRGRSNFSVENDHKRLRLVVFINQVVSWLHVSWHIWCYSLKCVLFGHNWGIFLQSGPK